MDVAPRGDRPPRQRNGAGLADRAIRSPSTDGRTRLVEPRRRQFPSTAHEGRSQNEWTAREWSKNRQGWIFITSQPAEREALRPLHSLWIDMLVLRLLSAPRPDQHPVWFVIDELASLQKLPQLHTAITENRKSHNPLVLGFQAKTQLEVIYGHLAEVMLSQPATKIFLRTTEPNAAEWVSRAIGKVEIERMKETHFDGHRSGRNFSRSIGRPSHWCSTPKSADWRTFMPISSMGTTSRSSPSPAGNSRVQGKVHRATGGRLHRAGAAQRSATGRQKLRPSRIPTHARIEAHKRWTDQGQSAVTKPGVQAQEERSR